ncbi:ABC transporter substrate-binding protein [Limnospira indica]|uniref:Polyamine transporter subunit periplasmic-binding component of ABC superfamily n=1 Tax=Limnospira indica PCC 8005 TaxID=376219 RepID=A0A9P1KKU9_9CYAN|nr:spermidine/putrescine ABC transporter substrate-binding protein [Limnospira indica]CDM97801.1 polyamine transporter subunit; periplasmic-binding component of ABC superfamily [Limnospira indica PCC 8005]
MQTRRGFLQSTMAAAIASSASGCGWTLGEIKTTPSTRFSSDTLYIYTWAGYTDRDLLERFTQETGLRVVADVFDSNEAMLARIQAGGAGAYSIIYPSEYMVQKMVALGLLAELDHTLIVGLEDLFPKFQNPDYDPNSTYSVPLSWGTTGLIYNSRLLSNSPEDWEDLWTYQDQLNRRLTLLNDVREVMGASLRRLGYSYNSTNPREINQAYQELVKLRGAIASFTTDAWRPQMIVGDLLLAMCYSSDAAEVMPENEDLEYITPVSGSSLWIDTLVIPKSAPNPEGAYQWINFMLRPDIATQIVERLSFATPSLVAYRQLPQELREDPALFPPESVIANSETVSPLPPEITALFDRYWTRLTSG